MMIFLFGFVSNSLFVKVNKMIHNQMLELNKILLRRRCLPGRSAPLACLQLNIPGYDEVFDICFKFCKHGIIIENIFVMINLMVPACLQLSTPEYDEVFDRFCYRYCQHVIIMENIFDVLDICYKYQRQHIMIMESIFVIINFMVLTHRYHDSHHRDCNYIVE